MVVEEGENPTETIKGVPRLESYLEALSELTQADP